MFYIKDSVWYQVLRPFFFFKLDKGKFDWQIPEEGFLKQTLNSLKLKEVYKLQNGI